MKGRATATDVDKSTLEKNPNEPIFTQDQADSNLASQQTSEMSYEEVAQPSRRTLFQNAAPHKDLVQEQSYPPLEDAKGSDEVMSQPPQPAATSAPQIDALLKRALLETAQEEIHEVMSKREASKLGVGEKPRVQPEGPLGEVRVK